MYEKLLQIITTIIIVSTSCRSTIVFSLYLLIIVSNSCRSTILFSLYPFIFFFFFESFSSCFIYGFFRFFILPYYVPCNPIHVKARYLGIAFHRGQNAVSCNFSDCSVAGSRQLKSHLEREHGMLPPSSRKMRGTIGPWGTLNFYPPLRGGAKWAKWGFFGWGDNRLFSSGDGGGSLFPHWPKTHSTLPHQKKSPQ